MKFGLEVSHKYKLFIKYFLTIMSCKCGSS